MVTVEMAVSVYVNFYANGRGGPIQNRRLQCKVATIECPGERMYLQARRQAKGRMGLLQRVPGFSFRLSHPVRHGRQERLPVRERYRCRSHTLSP